MKIRVAIIKASVQLLYSYIPRFNFIRCKLKHIKLNMHTRCQLKSLNVNQTNIES